VENTAMTVVRLKRANRESVTKEPIGILESVKNALETARPAKPKPRIQILLMKNPVN